jgi:AcrR family transcriptional regulator
MGRARFDQAGFLAAARELIAERGPAAVSVDAVAERLEAPKGSFYYRFASRDALLGELWLTTVLAFQQGFVAAIEAGDGLSAALHTPAWARRHLDDARLLMLYSRHDFVHGDWPAALKRGVADQAERFEACLRTFARAAFGRAVFVLAEVPLAAVKPHLQRREPPPRLVDELIAKTYYAIVGVDSGDDADGGARTR